MLGGASLPSGFVSDFPSHSWDDLRCRLSCRDFVMRDEDGLN